MTKYDCWSLRPNAHPWYPQIIDVACGYHARMGDRLCEGCRRQREETTIEQLNAFVHIGYTEDGLPIEAYKPSRR